MFGAMNRLGRLKENLVPIQTGLAIITFAVWGYYNRKPDAGPGTAIVAYGVLAAIIWWKLRPTSR